MKTATEFMHLEEANTKRIEAIGLGGLLSRPNCWETMGDFLEELIKAKIIEIHAREKGWSAKKKS